MDVPVQRPMGERQVNPRCDLVDRSIIGEVGADLPIRFAKLFVIDPSAAGRLEKRVDEEQQELPTWHQDTRDFVNRGLERLDVLEG